MFAIPLRIWQTKCRNTRFKIASKISENVMQWTLAKPSLLNNPDNYNSITRWWKQSVLKFCLWASLFLFVCETVYFWSISVRFQQIQVEANPYMGGFHLKFSRKEQNFKSINGLCSRNPKEILPLEDLPVKFQKSN